MDYTFEYISPVGTLTLASDGENLTGLWLKGQKYFASTLNTQNTTKDLPIFQRTIKWLSDYFNGIIPTSTPPLSPKGTAFRQAVWSILLSIPYGQVVTYKDISQTIAKQLGRPTMSAQAVGSAVGHNPISIIIPCHRVVGTSGSMTGYAGGLEIKEKLLNIEGLNISNFHVLYKK